MLEEVLSFGYLTFTSQNEVDLDNLHIYRPQRSWGKVIFSAVCVNNSVHRGGMRGFIWGGMHGFI